MEIPKLYTAMIIERDLYMAHGLMKMLNSVAASEYTQAHRKGKLRSLLHNGYSPCSGNAFPGKSVCLIAVVGSAHVPGIKRNWGRNISDKTIVRLLM